jgi:hypothetical protein
MLRAKAFVPLPMHSMGLLREISEHSGAPAKPLTNLLRLDDVAMTRHCLSCRIRQPEAMPTSPQSIVEFASRFGIF